MRPEDETAGVALRSADPGTVAQVRRLAELAGAALTVVPAGPAPPGAVVVLEDGGEGRLAVRVAPDRLRRLPDAAAVPDVVVLPAGAEALLDLLLATGTPHRARTVGVVGAHGGAGATVLGAALARACVGAGLAAALVDLDPAGGLDVLLGLDRDPGQRWADLDGEQGALVPRRLALALPEWHLVRVLSGDRRGGADPLGLVTRSAARALGQGHDVVVLDLPRQVLAPGPARELWLGWCSDVVLIARGGVRGGAAVLAAAPALAGRPAYLVLRGADDGDAAELAAAAGLTLAAHMRDERALPAGIEHGVTPGDQRRGHLRATGRALVGLLGLVP
ncbi:hypothetical protein [Georgenia sp. AZ-5]|uniref:hypothetical protein n=1 Tax=Georgenia sp. AZ-5 TaxID=3367526 RepID=UPI003754AE83